jgi:hypothetical protein
MAYAYHGNYCGPGWSGGKYQESVISKVPAVDSFDESCKVHDALYAAGGDRGRADLNFFKTNITAGPKEAAAGLLVGLQGVLRYAGVIERQPVTQRFGYLTGTVDRAQVIPSGFYFNHPDDITTNISKSIFENKNTSMPLAAGKISNSSKLSKLPKTSRMKPKQKKLRTEYSKLNAIPASASITTAPVSIGTTVVATKPMTISTREGIRVVGREFLCNVYESSNSNWQLSALAPLHPAFYVGSTMGQLARAYQYYRFGAVRIHFVTRQPTSVTGEIALCYSATLTEPAENGASSTFVARVMTRGDAILGPLWTNHVIEVPCDDKWRLVDAFSQPDISLNIMGEVQAYTLSGVTDTAGYLLIDYALDFKTTMFAPHSTNIPISSGPGASYTLTDTSTTPTQNSAVQMSNSTLTGFNNGTVIKLVCDADESTPSTGTTLANAWATSVERNTTTTTASVVTSGLVIADGLTIYGVVIGTSIYLYSTYEQAVSGTGSGQLYYSTTGSSAAAYIFNGYVVRFGNAILPATQ